MQQDVQVMVSEETMEVVVLSEGVVDPGSRIGSCFGNIFIIRG